MNVYIDDIRDMPEKFDVHFRSYEEALPWIKENWTNINLISFDHDMGMGHYLGFDTGELMNGHQAIRKLYAWARDTGQNFVPRMICHSANPVGRANILAVIADFNHLLD